VRLEGYGDIVGTRPGAGESVATGRVVTVVARPRGAR
jgi:beta-lactam-binding protein with PASTA domain